MKSFTTWDDLEIVYQEWGEETPSGPPVVLHHGFVADANVNWVAPGVVDALLAAQASSVFRGHIALDCISAPTLILAGEDDPLAVRPEVLADAIPDATLEIPSGNHVGAIADPRFIESIVDFLA